MSRLPPAELTTVSESFAVVHRGDDVRRYDDLASGGTHELDGVEVLTLGHPGGELLARFGTVNDLHFGETVCGLIEGLDNVDTFSVSGDEEP